MSQDEEISRRRLEVFLAEYKFLRDEVIARQNQRTQISYAMYLAISALSLAYVQFNNPWILLLTPIISLMLLYQVYSTYRVHDLFVQRALVIEDEINKLTKDNSIYWQHFYNEMTKERKNDRQSSSRRVSKLLRKNVFMFPIIISLVVAWSPTFQCYYSATVGRTDCIWYIVPLVIVTVMSVASLILYNRGLSAEPQHSCEIKTTTS